MNSRFTADTRPRISSGVLSCTSVERTTTLTTSAAPSTAIAAIDSGSERDRPNTIVASPNSTTEPNISGPARPVIGRLASHTDIASAPTAGEARSSPSASGLPCRMSSA